MFFILKVLAQTPYQRGPGLSNSLSGIVHLFRLMASSQWGNDGPDVCWSDLQAKQFGDEIDVVVQLACWDRSSNVFLGVTFPCNTTIRIEGLGDLDDTTQVVTIFNATCRREPNVLVVTLGPHSNYIEHRAHEAKDFYQAVEICSGLGVATWGLRAAGVTVQVACESQKPFVDAYQHFHEDTIVVHGDVTQHEVIKKVCMSCDQPGVVFAGFSCQPYSRGGMQKGGEDSRSATLGSALRISFLLRAPIIILECVPEAANNRQVRKELRQFCEQCKYHGAETFLKMENIWPCKRERWWIILTASTLGSVPLKPLPVLMHPTCVRQVLPFDLPISQTSLDQLILQGSELERFLSFQPNLESMLLKRGSVCPTILHSMGSQVVGCECGCRTMGFSDNTLSTRGIYGILCRVTSTPGAAEAGSFRHPHPDEIALLTAVPLQEQWPSNVRMVLAGLGQQANPAQMLWVMTQALLHVETLLLGTSAICPRKCLDQYLDQMRIQAKDLMAKYQWCHPMPPFDECDDEIPVKADDATLQAGRPATIVPPESMVYQHLGDETSFTLYADEQGQPCVIRLSQPHLTVGNLRAAEVNALPTIGVLDIVDPLTEEPLANNEFLAGKCILVRPMSLHDVSMDGDSPFEYPIADHPETEVGKDKVDFDAMVSPTMLFSIRDEPIEENDLPEVAQALDQPEAPLDPLAALKASEFLQLRPPTVPNMQTVLSMTQPTMKSAARQQIMISQEDLWTDDEIRWHLGRILSKAASPSKVLLDPLIATAVVISGQAGLIYQWFRSLSCTPTVIATAVWHEGHWTPLAWTWTSESATAHSWDVHGPVPKFNILHDAIAKAVGARTYITHVFHRQFALDQFCGVCAVRWLDHFLTGQMLPTNEAEAEHLNKVGKEMFLDHLDQNPMVQRPWLWGAGLDHHVSVRFRELLQQHRVPSDQLEARIHLVTQAIGVAPLQKALVGTSPWRSIKAIANQQRPPVQLVLPDELAEVLKSKAVSGTTSTRRKNNGSKSAQNAPKQPPALDVSKLTLDGGKFVDEMGNELKQIPVTSLGPASQGVALATISDVEPFLRHGTAVAPGPLAIFLVNATEEQIQTPLQWAQCRTVLRCVLNSEPMLVQGFLIQLGGEIVSQVTPHQTQDIGDVQAACIKVTIYRDSIVIPWSDFQAAPVKAILSLLPPLQVCPKEANACECDKWHGEPQGGIKDPVLDVWRRQWLNLAFNQVSPNVADAFAVNIRCVKSAEFAILAMSGSNGLFAEPRSLDGKQTVSEYHIIWMPRASISDLQHVKQTTPAVVGLARLGSRLGVRTRSSDASEVSKILRPDAIVLAAGPKSDFEIGPVPFGMDRSALATLCNSLGWKIKPVSPVRSAEGLGMIWSVQSCTDPPSHAFQTKRGEIVVNKVPSKLSSVVGPTSLPVTSAKTLKLCTLDSKRNNGGEDPLMRNDPWAAAVSKIGCPAPADPNASLKQVEERIEKSILARLPKTGPTPMEVDSQASDCQDRRLGELELQVQKLTKHQQHLEAKVDESHRKQDAQMAQMQHQVSSQFESQSNRIEELFGSQLAQIESLLGKRARME